MDICSVNHSSVGMAQESLVYIRQLDRQQLRVNFAARCWFALGALVNMDEASPDSPKGLLACISLSWSGRTGHNDIQLNGHQSGAVALEWPSCNACLSVDHINMQSKARILEL